MTRARIYLGILVALLLSGCSYHVKVNYLKPRQAETQTNHLSNVYMIVNVDDLDFDIDLDRMASQVAAGLRDRGGRLSLYSTTSTEMNPLIQQIRPSSILWVRFTSGNLAEKEETETVTEKVDDKEVTRNVEYWEMSGSLSMKANLVAYEDKTELGADSGSFSASKRYEKANSGDQNKRFNEQMKNLNDQASKWIVKNILPIEMVTHQRKLYTVKNDNDTGRAARAAKEQKWEEAVSVWKKRATLVPPNWRDAWNLAVWSESTRHYDDARRYYTQAQELSKGDPDAPKEAQWAETFHDIDHHVEAAPLDANCAEPWFRQSIAVLPFTDVSTSVDGPVNVRKLTRETLAHMGYRPLATDVVDQILRDHGFTQGGQLSATTPEQLAQWLQVDLLLYGHLEKFDEMSLGILSNKRIEGTYKLWSASKKSYVWVNDKTFGGIKTEKFKTGGDIGWAFLKQLGSSWVDKASGKPMSKESAGYVRLELSGLPRQPK